MTRLSIKGKTNCSHKKDHCNSTVEFLTSYLRKTTVHKHEVEPQSQIMKEGNRQEVRETQQGNKQHKSKAEFTF